MKITLERKILENAIDKENNIIDKNVNDNMDKKINANYFGEKEKDTDHIFINSVLYCFTEHYMSPLNVLYQVTFYLSQCLVFLL